MARNGQGVVYASAARGGGSYAADVSAWSTTAWASIKDKPTTLEGYGITDALNDQTTFWGQKALNGAVSGTLNDVGGINMDGDIEGVGSITMGGMLAIGGGAITYAEGRMAIDTGLAADGRIDASGGVRCGSYLAGASGAQIDEAGNAEVESIVSRSWLKVRELIYNRLNALEGDTSFADSGTIESLEWASPTKCVATMRKRWDGDFTSFQPGDVVYGYVNNLGNGAESEHYKSWARVAGIDREANSLSLVMYSDADVPSGANHPVAEGMTIARWGNNIEPSAEAYANPDYSAFIVKRGEGYANTRRQSFFISCEDGAIIELMGVYQPKLEAGNYGAVLGKIPAGLLPASVEELVNKDQPYLYARGIVVQDLLRVNYQGLPVREANYRGAWSFATAASVADHYRSEDTIYDTVTHNGSLWQCLSTGTTDEPSEDSAGWAVLVAAGQDGKDGENGVQGPAGEDGSHVENRYNADPVGLNPMLINPNAREPQGWSTDLPHISAGQALWMITATIAADGTLVGPWQGPTRISGDPGEPGGKGDKGDPGEDGAPGVDGRDGLLAYPAGEYDPNTDYSSLGDTTPVVLYNGNYYSLVPGVASYKGSNEKMARSNPALDVANATEAVPARWRLFDKFRSVFADILMAEFAKLGSAVFYGDWMISQQGTQRDTERAINARFGDSFARMTGEVTNTAFRYLWSTSPSTTGTSTWTLGSIPDKPAGREYLWARPTISNPASSLAFSAFCLNPAGEEVANVAWQFFAGSTEDEEPYESEWTDEPTNTASRAWMRLRAIVTYSTAVITDNSTRYEKFKEGKFWPNVAINFRTGEGSFRGDIRADGLTLGVYIDPGLTGASAWQLISSALVVAQQGRKYALPMIAPGHSRVIEVLFARFSASDTGGFTLRGATGNVYISERGLCYDGAWAKGGTGDDAKEYDADEPGIYRLIGFGVDGGEGYDDYTVWNVCRADDGGNARNKLRIKGASGTGPSGGVFDTIVGDSIRDGGLT